MNHHEKPPRSIERIVATAIGAVEAFYFGVNLITFALGIFIAGLPSIAFVSKTPLLCPPYSNYYLLHFYAERGPGLFVSVRSHLVDTLK